MRRRDPLAIDLTGDGIKTVAINTTAPILFDHNGDGAKSATGWLDGSDAWLVRDFGNDGIIASGLELFGVDTDITVNNVTRKAMNGFEALAALDANGDKIFNTTDAAFTQVQLWQDLNQNGVSDAGELSTLADKGITSIALNFTSTNTNLGNGNTVTGKAVVTRTTGTSEIDSVSVAADSAAYNLNLADNPFYSQLPAVQLTGTATALPEMHGSGSVHGLREAMSLGTSEATTLTNTVTQFAAATTRDAQMALLDQLVQQWGATSTLTTSSPFVPGAPDEFTLANPSDPMGEKIQTFARANPALYHKIIALEQFNGQTGLTQLINRWGASLPSAVTTSLENAYAALRESTYSSLTVQTRLKPYFEAVSIVIDASNIYFDTYALATKLDTYKSADAKNALIDLIELNRYAQDTFNNIGFDGLSHLRSWVNLLAVDSPLRATLVDLHVLTGTTTTGSSYGDIYLGDNSTNIFSGRDDADLIDGGGGDDALYGNAGNDTLVGRSGNDYLSGGAGADVYTFGKGDGKDLIDNSDGETIDANSDTILINSDVKPSDVTLSRQDGDLIISINGNDDALRVQWYFINDGASNYAVKSIQFTDGTVWDVSTVKAKMLEPTSSNDTLIGYASNDVISAGGGDDNIYGQAGNDSLDGESGNDLLVGGTGDDSLDGETGNDLLVGDTGNDTYWFGLGDGNDTIQEGSNTPDKGGIDVLRIRSGVRAEDVRISRDNTDVVLTLPGHVENQTFITDSIRLQNVLDADGNSAYCVESVGFDDGTTWSIDDLKSRLLTASESDDLIQGYATPDELHGIGGNDTLIGNDGADNLYGDAGKDHLYGGKGDDYLDGGTDDDTLSGGSGNNLYRLKLGGGNDIVERDRLDSLSTTDTVLVPKSVGLENVEFSREGLDIVFRIKGTQDSIRFKDAMVSDGVSANYTFMYGVEGGATVDLNTIKASLLQGGAGNDTVIGYATNENLTGGLGNDVLNANAGNDTLEGGTGQDTLDGGQGDDTYLFGKSDGQDIILRNTLSNESNTLKFKAGVAPDDIKLVRAGNDLIVSIANTNDKITIDQFFAFNNPSRGYNAIQQIAFTDSATMWDIPTITAKALAGTDACNSIIGTLNADIITGLGGDDVLIGQEGNDTIDGGSGNDQLAGSLGNDTYRFGKGDGQDTIAQDNDISSSKINTLEFKSGLAPKDIAVTRSGNDLILSIIGTQDKITASQFFGDDYTGLFRSPLQRVTFADIGYTPWSMADLTNKALAGTDQNDRLSGTASANLLSGQAGADVLFGQDGNDTLDGGTGNDRLSGGLGNDTYRFGIGDGQDTIMADGEVIAGKLNTLEFKSGLATKDIAFARVDNDLVLSIINTQDKVTISQFFAADNTGNANNPIQQITFKDGDAALNLASILSKVLSGSMGADSISGTLNGDTISGQSGDDVLYGKAGDDVLDGGTGNDQLSGGLGNDTYKFGKGDGQDVIAPDGESITGKANTLQFKTGVAVGDVKARRSGNDLILSITNTTDQITVLQFFNGDDTGNVNNPIQKITFVDSSTSTWDLTTITNKVFEGSGASDNISGTLNADAINGQAGIDMLYGRSGMDTLDGGTGNDYLSGGLGNDTYKFGKGDGLDTILIDSEAIAGKLNTLTFKAGVLPSEVQARRNGSDLELSIANTADKVIVSQFFSGDDPSNVNNPIQQVTFTDSAETWNLAAIKDQALAGTSSADKIVGTLTADSLAGGAGDDILYGQAGNDTFEGGAGNDQLSGGLGNDTYKFGKGDGQDVIGSDIDGATGKLNTLLFKPGVAYTEVVGSRKGNDLILGIVNTSDQVTISNFFYNEDPANRFNPIQQVQFDGGPTWDLTQIKSLVPTQAPSYTVIGTAGADLTLNGTAGADTIYGLAGGDSLWGGGGSDYLDGGADNDGVYGGNGVTDNDTLIGGTGDDTLDGRAGDDTLDGGGGNDVLQGGSGSNTFLFGFGSDADGVNVNPSHLVNTLQFKPGITEQDVLVMQSGANLFFSLTNSPNDRFSAWGFFLNNDPFSSSNPINQVRFNDGTVWSCQDVINRALRAGAGVTIGTIYDDTLEGGLGSDELAGGLGNNTYLYNRGDGQDLIRESVDPSPNKLNTLYFKGDIAPSEISAKRNGVNLELRVAGSPAPITVSSFFLDDNPANIKNPIQQIRFENGTILDLAAIVALLPSGMTGPVTGTPADDAIVGSAMADTILGQGGADTLTGGGGGDRLEGGADNDSLVGGNATTDNDMLFGGWGNDTLDGRGGDDTLDGGAGNDTLQGDLGSNTFLFGIGSDSDFLSAKPGRTTSTLQFKPGITEDDVIVTQSGAGAIFSLRGSPTDRFVAWDFFKNNDPLSSGSINVVRFDDGKTWTVQDIVNHALQGWQFQDYLVGTTQGDVLTADGGLDVLNGGMGNNTYVFGKGETPYTYRTTIQAFDDPTPGKLNTVLFTDDVSTDDVHLRDDGNGNLILDLGGSDITITSFFLNNDPTNSKNPVQQIQFANGVKWDLATLTTLAKGNGWVDWNNTNSITGTDAPDRIFGQEGNDTIASGGSVDHLFGGADSDALYGGDDNDWLYGEDGADFLDGGAGADVMRGGSDDDSYIVDNPADQVIESADGSSYGGVDNVMSSVNYSLPDNVEVLQLMGTAAIDATGNALGNHLFGNVGNNHLYGQDGADFLSGEAGADTLDGGAGADTLKGGAGDDVYYIDGAIDLVIEAVDSGRDTVRTTQDYIAPDNVELLIAMGSGNLTIQANKNGTQLVGNTGNNLILGGNGADRLSGGGGFDTLQGGAGNDFYFVTNSSTRIVETIDGGLNDQAVVYIDNYVIADNLDRVTLITSTPITCYGNDRKNIIVGNFNGNYLFGGGSGDLLSGGGGNDTLRGGTSMDLLKGEAGDDLYVMGRGDGMDIISNNDASGNDTLLFEGVDESQLWFKQSGNDLTVSIIGTADGARISLWFNSQEQQVDNIKVGATGKSLSASKVGTLLQAMSTMAPPASGQTTLPPNYQEKLNAVIAANWV